VISTEAGDEIITVRVSGPWSDSGVLSERGAPNRGAIEMSQRRWLSERPDGSAPERPDPLNRSSSAARRTLILVLSRPLCGAWKGKPQRTTKKKPNKK